MIQSKKLLITGGLGYVGGRIANHLKTAKPDLDIRLMTRNAKSDIPDWTSTMQICSADMRDKNSLTEAVTGVDTVIHLAALNEIESQEDHISALYVNGLGTNHLLDACQTAGVQNFIYFSTFHVYDQSSNKPINESSPTRPIHPYAFSHRLAEDYINWHKSTSDLETLIVRLSNGYGYPMTHTVNRWTLVFNDLCNQAVLNKQIILRSSGTQHRDFISLHDVSRAIEHLIFQPDVKWQDGLFNLGGNCSLSIAQVAHIIANEYGLVYGIPPSVTLGKDNSNVSSEKVSYNITKLLDTGFTLTGNMKEEIRATFRMCEIKNGIGQA